MTPWDRATLALTLLAIDPKGFSGLIVRARVSPVRDAFMQIAKQLLMPQVKLHPSMAAQVLDGEIDLSSTLKSNALVMQKGLLDRPPSLFTLPMAERADPYLTARLSQTLDTGDGHCFLALDEGVDEDESIPTSLSDRAAFWVSLDGLALADFDAFQLPENLEIIAKAVRKVDIPDDIPEQLVTLAVSHGPSSCSTSQS
jgi:magnesium chelatase subunit D